MQNTRRLSGFFLLKSALTFFRDRNFVRLVGSPKIFLVAKKIMFGTNSLLFRFRHLELNFERNQDQEWTSFA